MQYTARINTSTINRYVKQIISPIFRKSVVLGMLQSRGRMKYNVGGLNLVWTVRYLRRQIRNVLGAVTSTQFPNTSTKVQMILPWAAYDMGESIAKLEKLVNQGSEVQIYNLYETVLKELLDDFTEAWRLRLWQDGTNTNNDLMGLLSMFGSSTTPTGAGVYSNPRTNFTAGTTQASGAWWCFSPHTGNGGTDISANKTTYAGLSTQLGAKVNDYAGATSSTYNYPKGTFSEAYNFNTPLMVDYQSTAFTPNPAAVPGGSSSALYHSWENQWQQACNALQTYLGVLQKEPVDLILLDPDLMRRAKDSQIGQQRFTVSDSSETRSLGFKALEYNGCEFMDEYGAPTGQGIAVNFNRLTYHCMQGQLIERTEDKDIVTSEDLFKFDNYGQLQMEAGGYFGLLAPVTTLTTSIT